MEPGAGFGRTGLERDGKTTRFALYAAETRHNRPLAFTMQQGPIPTQLCCGTSKLGGARLTRMKESHEVYEIRQGTSVERPLCCGRPQRYVLRGELFSWLFVCDGYGDLP